MLKTYYLEGNPLHKWLVLGADRVVFGHHQSMQQVFNQLKPDTQEALIHALQTVTLKSFTAVL